MILIYTIAKDGFGAPTGIFSPPAAIHTPLSSNTAVALHDKLPSRRHLHKLGKSKPTAQASFRKPARQSSPAGIRRDS